MKQREIKEKLCMLVKLVRDEKFPEVHADCFCGGFEKFLSPETFELHENTSAVSDEVYKYIETAVLEQIAREK